MYLYIEIYKDTNVLEWHVWRENCEGMISPHPRLLVILFITFFFFFIIYHYYFHLHFFFSSYIIIFIFIYNRFLFIFFVYSLISFIFFKIHYRRECRWIALGLVVMWYSYSFFLFIYFLSIISHIRLINVFFFLFIFYILFSHYFDGYIHSSTNVHVTNEKYVEWLFILFYRMGEGKEVCTIFFSWEKYCIYVLIKIPSRVSEWKIRVFYFCNIYISVFMEM